MLKLPTIIRNSWADSRLQHGDRPGFPMFATAATQADADLIIAVFKAAVELEAAARVVLAALHGGGIERLSECAFDALGQLQARVDAAGLSTAGYGMRERV